MSDEIRNCGDLDERLAPYVDGEATPESRRGVDAHLAACPPCQEAARAQSAARQIVQEHRDRLAMRAPDSLRARCEAAASVSSLQPPVASGQKSRSVLRRWAPLSLAATLLLAVAGVFLFGFNNRVEALASSLVLDHVKCFAVSGTLSSSELAQSEAHWQESQGWSIRVPPTDPAEQLRLINVRRCFTTDGRSAHMLYMWRGAPLSLYVLQEDAGRDCVVSRMGHEAAIWCANGRTYAVVANGHPDGLAHVIDYLKAHAR